MEDLGDVYLLFVSTEVCGRERGHAWKRVDICRDDYKDERKSGA